MMKTFRSLLTLLLVFAFIGFCSFGYARSTASTDTGTLGADQWSITADGDLIPNSASNDIGSSSYPINDIYATGAVIDNINFAADAEASDTYKITLDPAPTAYTTGMMIIFTANTANTGACTLNVNGLGAKSIKKLHDQDPGNNDIEATSVVMVVYDGTNFQMLQPEAN